MEDHHQLWHDVAGGGLMPTMVNPYFWDQFQLRRRNLIPRRFDSMYGEKNMTIIQLDENVITDPFRHALYAYPRMYAREEHVVDWSGIKQEDLVQYFYGMALRYGMPQEWPEIDKFEMEHQWPVASGDRNVYRIAPPLLSGAHTNSDLNLLKHTTFSPPMEKGLNLIILRTIVLSLLDCPQLATSPCGRNGKM